MAMPTEKQRLLAAIMFTDMVGYTALMQTNEQLAIQQRTQHRNIITEEVKKNNGEILQYYGDGTLMIFTSAIEAVKAGVQIQLSLKKLSIPLRIGIHTGDIVYEAEGVYGDGVNLAARIESLSVEGAVFISDKVYDDIKNHPDFTSQSMGIFELKNVQRPIEVFAISNTDLTIPLPHEIRGKTTSSFKSIAVLPFVNMSTDPENEYFSDGITEEIINALSSLEGLKITSRTSSFAFKGKNEDVRKIADTLGVKTILEGSVRKAGNKVRINAQLINAQDGYQLWNQAYNRKLEDIFEVQDEIAKGIANELKNKLTSYEIPEKMIRTHTNNIEAYHLYLKGLHYTKNWTPENFQKAIQAFEKVTQQDPTFALAYANLALCYSFMGATGQSIPQQTFPKAEAAAQKALTLDDSLPESHMALGMMNLLFLWEYDKSELAFQKALRLNPSAAIIHQMYGFYLCAMGRAQESIQRLEYAAQLDPLSIPILILLTQLYSSDGQFEKASQQLEKALELAPNYRGIWEAQGWLYLRQNKIEEGIQAFEKYHQMIGDPLKGLGGLGHAYGKGGYTQKALNYIERLKKRQIRDKETMLEADFATIYLGMGNLDKVFEHFEKALQQQVSFSFAQSDSLWKEVWEDPRYQKLIDKYQKSK